MGWPYTSPHGDIDALPGQTDGKKPGDVPMVILGAFDGANIWRQRTPSKFLSQNAVAVAAETTIWTPAAGKKFRLLGFATVMGSVTGAYVFKDNTAGATILTLALTANVAVPFFMLGYQGILSAAANNVLTCTGPGASALSGTVLGSEE